MYAGWKEWKTACQRAPCNKLMIFLKKEGMEKNE